MPARNLYQPEDYKRRIPLVKERGSEFRSEFQRDVSRLIHCPSFRRLQGKTQLFPDDENDFFRNRLTHSIEVAQIAKAIGSKFNQHAFFRDHHTKIDLDLLEFSALAHDLGHPPFGHNGEKALDAIMQNHGGYEGNAQTLRILTRLEKKQFEGDATPRRDSAEIISPGTQYDTRAGLNCCYRSLAAILKYDECIPEEFDQNQNRPIKGYYYFDKSLVDTIKTKVVGNTTTRFKTIECRIMDIADDIAYSTYDLEDCLKAGFLSIQDFFMISKETAEAIIVRLGSPVCSSVDEVRNSLKNVFLKHITPNSLEMVTKIIAEAREEHTGDQYLTSMLNIVTNYIASISKLFKMMSHQGYERAEFTAALINKFIESINLNPNDEYPMLSSISIDEEDAQTIEVLKQFNYVKIIQSPMLKIAEHRGKDIINKLFSSFIENPRLLPEDMYDLFTRFPEEKDKKRQVCDFIAGMTDRYAVEFYSRLYSETPESIFKPIG